jgi:hypothetical protein
MTGILLYEDLEIKVVIKVYTTLLIWFLFIYKYTACLDLIVIFRCIFYMSEITEYYYLHIVSIKEHFRLGLGNKTIFVKFCVM